MYSKEELANDFPKLGVRAADTVMLQASVRGWKSCRWSRLHTPSPQNGEWVPGMAR